VRGEERDAAGRHASGRRTTAVQAGDVATVGLGQLGAQVAIVLTPDARSDRDGLFAPEMVAEVLVGRGEEVERIPVAHLRQGA
jgi:hypothetical protein